MKNIHKLFSYGTLQQENVQQSTFGRQLTGTTDTLIGYTLDKIKITDPDVLAKSGKTFHPILVYTGNNKDEVEGMIFEISDDELALADAYEVADYRRMSAPFKSGKTAWVYAAAKPIKSDSNVDINLDIISNHRSGGHSDNINSDISANHSNDNTDESMLNHPKSSSTETEKLQAFTQVIESRRSIRRFTDTPIPDAVLKDCLRMAMLAPNASNLQQWAFYIIDSPDIRKKANAYCLGQNAAKTANKLIAIVARTDNWRENAKQVIDEYPVKPVPKKVKRYYEKLIPLVYTQDPLNVLAVVKWGFTKAHRTLKGPVMTPYYTQADQVKWSLCNAFLAAENLMLALRAYGFDSCPMGGFDEAAMKSLLGLGNGHHIAMMIAAGERDDSGIYHEQFRFDYDQFVKHV